MKVEFCLKVGLGDSSFKVYRKQDVSAAILEATRINFGFDDQEPGFPDNDMLVMSATYHPPTDTTYVNLFQDIVGGQVGHSPMVGRKTKMSFTSYLCDLLREGWTLHRHEFGDEDDAQKYLVDYLHLFTDGDLALVHLEPRDVYIIIPAIGLRAFEAMKKKHEVIEIIKHNRKEQ